MEENRRLHVEFLMPADSILLDWFPPHMKAHYYARLGGEFFIIATQSEMIEFSRLLLEDGTSINCLSGEPEDGGTMLRSIRFQVRPQRLIKASVSGNELHFIGDFASLQVLSSMLADFAHNEEPPASFHYDNYEGHLLLANDSIGMLFDMIKEL